MMHGEGMLCWSDDFGVCRYKALLFIGGNLPRCWPGMATAMLLQCYCNASMYRRAPSSTTSSRVMVFWSGQ